MENRTHGEPRRKSLTERMMDASEGNMGADVISHIRELTSREGLTPATWFRWWIEYHGPIKPYRNVACSPKTDASFLEWVAGEKSVAKNLAEIEISNFKQYLEDAVVSSEIALSRPIPGVKPLVQYTLGRYLYCPQAVEWLEDAARDEILCKPWMREVLRKFKEYLPE